MIPRPARSGQMDPWDMVASRLVLQSVSDSVSKTKVNGS